MSDIIFTSQVPLLGGAEFYLRLEIDTSDVLPRARRADYFFRFGRGKFYFDMANRCGSICGRKMEVYFI
jgi:hypothetical protein